MNTKIIKTEQEYSEACARIYSLMKSSEHPIEPDSVEGEELELLSLLVEKHEHEAYSSVAPDPYEAILFRMEQMNLKQNDFASLFGGKTRVSQVLNGKKPLNLKMISLLHEYQGIPLQSFVIGANEVKLDPEKHVKLLNVPSISRFLSTHRAKVI